VCKKLFFAFSIAVLLAMVACTGGPNPMTDQPNQDGDVAGFFLGLWQGFICLFAFLVSLVNDNVRMYEVHNTGNWYNFGFLLGLCAFVGGCAGACSS